MGDARALLQFYWRGHEVEAFARIQPSLELLAGGEQLAAAAVQLLVQPPYERQGAIRQRFVVPLAGGCVELHVTSS